ncbi:GPI ethanolamine phosphate transferase 2 isoform X2 [Anoplophora glabripennis]|uniref:GPI ethanolamine phosphate transferase 2 isoform X2 n=1 Tax=Anoplophora glabripennis TaxID=217634 RepID=UPI00087417BF|nr:GPI ethanolamine phosphate transferase 2 isoform X2 [Anoplophora glabripennis]
MYPYHILIIFSLFLFLHGFFPITRSTNNISYGPPTYINNISLNPQVYTSDIQKTVLIIIDALRLDFVNTNYMPLTTHITKENGCFNTITVETPTVTLPRIKALTAGNVPQFIDLVLNLASTEILQDSLIHSLFKMGKRIVFYGDNTWLKLFPHFFTRYEGTSSFFVRDFKEVDDNVTRNVDTELKRNDWDMMILHYLGDHGMRDSGGHGGSSYFETHVPLHAIGLQCTNGSFFQTDIPVNLAVLLGLNIPSTSIGQIRSNLLPVSLEKYLYILRYNNLLLINKAKLCEDSFLLATKFHELYIKGLEETHALKAIDLYKNCSNSISKYLIKSSVKQNFNSLIISILIMFNSLAILIKYLLTQKYEKVLFNSVEYVTYLVIIFIQFISSESIHSVIFMIILTLLLMKNLVSFTKIKSKYQTYEDVLKLLILISIFHPLTFFSSSFVEEEHQYWYFFFNVLVMYIVLSKIRQLKNLFIYLGLLSSLRFLRTINSTGDKWGSYPDLSDWLLKTHNYSYYQLFFIFGLIATFFTCVLLNTKKVKMHILNLIILVCIFALKSTDYENVLLGKFIWFLILIQTIFFCDCPKIFIWIIISSLLLKPYNVVLISFCILTSMALLKIFQNSTIITICHFWLSNTLYFAQGHSNSLASVDVSVGYIGLNEYQPILVIFQVLCHTYSFPVLCHFLILQNKSIDSNRVWTILFCNRLYITVITCIITVIFRHHLFIWSVFAPKLFIESVHLMFLFIELSIYFCYKYLQSFLKMFIQIKL